MYGEFWAYLALLGYFDSNPDTLALFIPKEDEGNEELFVIFNAFGIPPCITF